MSTEAATWFMDFLASAESLAFCKDVGDTGRVTRAEFFLNGTR